MAELAVRSWLTVPIISASDLSRLSCRPFYRYHCHSLRRTRFLTRRGYFHYRMTFAAYIWCFCAQNLVDLVTLTFDLLTLAVSDELSFMHPTHIQILASYDYPFLSYVWLDLITLPSPVTVTGRMRRDGRVTRPITRRQNVTHFLTSLTQFTSSLFHFQGATTKIEPLYRQKIEFSHREGYKVHCACAISRDLCIGVPPKPQVTICWSCIVYSLYNFYRATMTTKVSLYWSIPSLNFRPQKIVQLASVIKMAVFRKFKVLNVKYS